ncbi:MAG: hypothetical protein AAF901_10845 [Bacteroidota bacterium]
MVALVRISHFNGIQSHVVRVVGFSDSGLIVDDPFGATSIVNFYNGNSRWSTTNSSNNNINGGASAGEGITWSWTDIAQIRFLHAIKITKQTETTN